MTLVIDEDLLDDGVDNPAQEAGLVVSRTCSRCEFSFPETDVFFTVKGHRVDGSPQYRNKCRECVREIARTESGFRARQAQARFEAGEEVASDLLELPRATDSEVAWKQRAKCRGLRWYQYSTAKQKQICETCPVATECRALADLVETTSGFTNVNSHVGVWGREGPADRRKRREFIARNTGGL